MVLFVVLACQLASDVTVSNAARHRVPEGFFGVAVPHLRDASYNNRISSFRVLESSGVETVSHVFDWAGIEPTKGEFHFEYADQAVRAAADAGLTLNVSIFNAPDWATSRPRSGARPGYYPPRNFRRFGDFAQRLVERYGPNGHLWRDLPPSATKPIRVWRIWNEPNLPVYWASGPNPRKYLALLRAARRAIHSVDPDAKVVTAGIPNSRLGIGMHEFIERMYRAGGRTVIDAVALNPYAVDHRGVLAAIKRTRVTMRRYRDSSTQIWISEIGWSDDGPPSPFFAGSAGQARRIRATVDGVIRVRRSAKIAGMIYFAIRDQLVSKDNDFWGNHTGLFTAGGTAKPAWSAFYGRARAARRVTGPLPPDSIPVIPGDPGYRPARSHR